MARRTAVHRLSLLAAYGFPSPNDLKPLLPRQGNLLEEYTYPNQGRIVA
jgi:hypothetical protein